MLGAGFALALAGLMGSAQATAPLTQGTTQNELKGTPATGKEAQERKVHSVGGLDLIQRGEYGMSPMQYGMMYGHGNKKGHTNLNRCSHNAKLKRRA